MNLSKQIVSLVLLCITMWTNAQVGIGTSTPNASAQLDISSTTMGILVPRMTEAQRISIYQPAEGLLLYQIDWQAGFYFYRAGYWENLSEGASNWSNAYTHIYNNNTGNVGIGTTNPSKKLDVNGDAQINGLTIGRGNGNESTNTAVGIQALNMNTTGSANTVVGSFSLVLNSSGDANTAMGQNSLTLNTTGSLNTAMGHASLYSNNTGNFNVGIGANALTFNTSGKENTASGMSALHRNTTGFYNTAHGSKALFSNTTGSNNSAVGDSALFNNVTGAFNTALGFKANVSSGTLTNATAIGYDAIVNANNKVRIGNSEVTVIEGQVAFSFPSDGRFKTNITESVAGLAFIRKLRPVVYNFQTAKYQAFTNGGVIAVVNPNSETSPVRQSGFIAQEVESAAKAAGYEFNGVNIPQSSHEAYSLSYSQFVVPLVKSVQELDSNHQALIIVMEKQAEKIAGQDKLISKQTEDIHDLRNQLETLKQMITVQKETLQKLPE